MPPQTETQTLPVTLARDVGEVAAALDLARRELAQASAECVALRRRNEHLERELVRLGGRGLGP